MPKISIIIPVYNSETTLHQCVDSILYQDYKDFEVLLIDDGSKDKSPAICDEYTEKDNRVKVFHKQNGGVSSARNLGLDYAKGDWITFVDSDDHVESNYLVDLTSIQSDLVIVGVHTFREALAREYYIYKYYISQSFEGKDLSLFLKKHISSLILRVPWAKFYKKKIIGSFRFHEDMKIAEDSCFVMDCLCNVSSIITLNTGTYYFRLSPSPARIKYTVSVDYAVKSLGYLYDSYSVLDYKFNIGHSAFLSFIGYFKRISQDDWRKEKKKWFCDKEIKRLYKYVWPDLTKKQKLYLIGSFVLRK